MMFRLLKVILLIVVAASIVACSATPTRRSFKEGWKDSVVSTKVKVKLTSDKLVKKRNIDVDTWRGVVTMTGRITSAEEKERAEQLAWQVKGVRGVDNYLKLVDDYMPEGEAVAKGADDGVVLTEVAEIKVKEKGNKVKIKEKDVITAKKVPLHPAKSQVGSQVEGPVVFDEDVTEKDDLQYTAKRERFKRPTSSQIEGEDLTSEDRLAQEAAEELRKLRGEDLAE